MAFGSATVDAAVAFPEPESRMTIKAILQLLQEGMKSYNAQGQNEDFNLFPPRSCKQC